MGRKKIREFDAKRLVQQYLPKFSPSTPLLDAKMTLVSKDAKFSVEKDAWLESTKLVVKPDMLFGQRGKHGLVLVNADLQKAESWVAEKMASPVTIKTANGLLTHFLAEQFVPHEDEYYLSFTSKRESLEIRFSIAGGVEVEANWDTIKLLDVPVGDEVKIEDIEKTLLAEITDSSKRSIISEFIRGFSFFFEDLDFTFFEMNPFALTKDSKIAILDAVAEVDGTAGYKSGRKWGAIEFPEPFGKSLAPEEKFVYELDEKTGASLKLTILNPEGRIWNLVAGGGASVIYADTVSELGYGSELGNYGEYSGAPNEEETYHYAKTVIELATRNPDGRGRALLIGGGIANFTDVAKTFKGIIHAMKELQEKLRAAKVHVYVRRAGPNYQRGLKLISELSKEINIPIKVFGPEVAMTSIIPMAVEYIKNS
eukprot:TRINITY_DN9290_c1_g1_i1.p1 TRINITY_DN9290_c1_g1~~TRINITY_DN9290_c1_g1_i1.p1  ORF type:complete len:426 (+),score=221.25 TRINITY_DN9290_c1_g1_i1:46-1323(+)